MRRAFIPALLAVAMISSASNASAFGLFDKLCGNSCDTGCDVCEPVCGCEMPAPACGCEVAEPCGCAAPAPSCRPRLGLFSKLFHKHNACDACVAEPVCGCEIAEPACGCEIAEPVCGCEMPAPCGCDAPAPCRKPLFGGLFKKIFHKHNHGCDCGCEVIEPACGCEIEPSCGFEAAPSCGCGH